jgi:hypothetical protein
MDLTCAEPPGHATHWTGRAMAKAVGVSLRAVQRLWEAHRLQPHASSHRLVGSPCYKCFYCNRNNLRDLAGRNVFSCVGDYGDHATETHVACWGSAKVYPILDDLKFPYSSSAINNISVDVNRRPSKISTLRCDIGTNCMLKGVRGRFELISAGDPHLIGGTPEGKRESGGRRQSASPSEH